MIICLKCKVTNIWLLCSKLFLNLYFNLKIEMDQSSMFKEVIIDELVQFDAYLKEAIKNEKSHVSKIVEYAFKRDGKRIRPMLVFLVAKSCGEVVPATYHGAVTVELLHAATLIHDDVIDESNTRRGRPSVNAIFDNKRAVLAGDYILSSSLVESAKTGNIEVIQLIAELGKNLAEGELNQYALADQVLIDEERYLDVIDKKTASLLYACAKIGAITAGASRDVVDAFGDVGRCIGMAFQIQDDIFDYFSTDVGKPTGNDIREGKITMPLIYALKNSSQDEYKSMMDIIESKNYTSENIETLLTFAKQSGGIDYAEKIKNDYLLISESIIDKLSLNQDYKEALELLIFYLKNRRY